MTYQRSAIRNQQSAISSQLSAVSYQQSAISSQLSAVSYQQSAISSQEKTINHQPFPYFAAIFQSFESLRTKMALSAMAGVQRMTLN